MASASGRMAWTFLSEGLTFRRQRLYETFWNSQSNLKWGLVLVYPAYLLKIRWRAETQYKYNVYIAEKENYPSYECERGIGHMLYSAIFGNGVAGAGGGYWSNGAVFYFKEDQTVGGLKEAVYKSSQVPPENLKVGCRGRVMNDSDNLALAVKNFCRRDPRILMWEEEL